MKDASQRPQEPTRVAQRGTARVLATAAVALLVLCIASTAAAGPAVKDPSAMILRQSDLRGWTYEAEADLDDYLRKPLQAAGLSGKAAQYYGVTFSQRRGSLKVSGVVLTVASAAEARRVFTITTKARDAFVAQGCGTGRRCRCRPMAASSAHA